MREFDSEQQMKQTVRCQCTQFQFTSRGKGLILPPGLKVRPASSPVIRIRNIPAKGDGCILRKLRVALAVQRRGNKLHLWQCLPSCPRWELSDCTNIQSYQIQGEKEKAKTTSRHFLLSKKKQWAPQDFNM